MSDFEKIMISVVENKLFKPIDFTNLTGYVGSYTWDPDHPATGEFYIMFDDTIRNDYSKDLATRLSKSTNVKREYVKIIDNKPYYVYCFWINRKLMDEIHQGVIKLTNEMKQNCIQFWSFLDSISIAIMNGHDSFVAEQKDLPCEDYNTSEYKRGLVINTKGDALH